LTSPSAVIIGRRRAPVNRRRAHRGPAPLRRPGRIQPRHKAPENRRHL